MSQGDRPWGWSAVRLNRPRRTSPNIDFLKQDGVLNLAMVHLRRSIYWKYNLLLLFSLEKQSAEDNSLLVILFGNSAQ